MEAFMKRLSLVLTPLVGLVIWPGVSAQAGSWQETPNWSGFYIGVNGGVGSFDAEITDLTGDMFDEEGAGVGLQSFDFVYGAQAGINWQRGSAVLGLEVDINGTTYDERLEFQAGDHDSKAAWKWFSTVRARVGLAVDNALVYATGGVAIIRAEYCGADGVCVSDGDRDIAFTTTELGFAAGAGAEIQIDPDWSLKAEYLYVDAGEDIRRYDTSSEEDAQFSSNAHIFRVGLNYHLRELPPVLETAQPLK
jgi:outer membrane immunogenic protein